MVGFRLERFVGQQRGGGGICRGGMGVSGEQNAQAYLSRPGEERLGSGMGWSAVDGGVFFTESDAGDL